MLLSSEMVFYDDVEGVVVAQAHRRDATIALSVDEEKDDLHLSSANQADDSTAAEKTCAEALERAAVAERKCTEALERADKAERHCTHLETEKVRPQYEIYGQNHPPA